MECGLDAGAIGRFPIVEFIGPNRGFSTIKASRYGSNSLGMSEMGLNFWLTELDLASDET